MNKKDQKAMISPQTTNSVITGQFMVARVFTQGITHILTIRIVQLT